MDTKPEVKPDWRAVRLNRTRDYSFEAADAAMVKAVYEVYAYDRNEHTHLCELTPSYYLVFLYASIDFVDGVSDEERERLDMLLDECDHDDTYSHVSSIDGIPDADKATFGEIPDDIDNPKEYVREHWTGNWPL